MPNYPSFQSKIQINSQNFCNCHPRNFKAFKVKTIEKVVTLQPGTASFVQSDHIKFQKGPKKAFNAVLKKYTRHKL